MGSFGAISRVCEALIVSSRERRFVFPSPAQALELMRNFGKDRTGGMTASADEVGSSNVIVYIPSGSPVSRLVPPSVKTPRRVHRLRIRHCEVLDPSTPVATEA
jgi:hypothetical protein